MEGQISLFDIFDIIPTADENNHDKIKEIENREILKGSGFAEGKTRIYNFFQENHTEKEYADFLKNEYGVGGWSIDEGFCDHNANGIDLRFDKEIGKCTALHIGWPMVVRRIKTLIEQGKYKPNECKHSGHVCNKKALFEVADTLDEIICPHVCCRACSEKMCGARCNGAEQPKEKPLCSKAEKCEAYPLGCGGTIEPCRFGGPFNWSNKSEEAKEDIHIDREGREHKAPSWMKYERCENCIKWQRHDIKDQPPSGWGIYGFCMEHKYRCNSCGYCNNFEEKR